MSRWTIIVSDRTNFKARSKTLIQGVNEDYTVVLSVFISEIFFGLK